MSIYDFRGLKCPIPVLKAHKVIKEQKKTDKFTFLTNDASAPEDFKNFCTNTGHQLLEINKIKKYYEIKIKKVIFEK